MAIRIVPVWVIGPPVRPPAVPTTLTVPPLFVSAPHTHCRGAPGGKVGVEDFRTCPSAQGISPNSVPVSVIGGNLNGDTPYLVTGKGNNYDADCGFATPPPVKSQG